MRRYGWAENGLKVVAYLYIFLFILSRWRNMFLKCKCLKMWVLVKSVAKSAHSASVMAVSCGWGGRSAESVLRGILLAPVPRSSHSKESLLITRRRTAFARAVCPLFFSASCTGELATEWWASARSKLHCHSRRPCLQRCIRCHLLPFHIVCIRRQLSNCASPLLLQWLSILLLLPVRGTEEGKHSHLSTPRLTTITTTTTTSRSVLARHNKTKGSVVVRSDDQSAADLTTQQQTPTAGQFEKNVNCRQLDSLDNCTLRDCLFYLLKLSNINNNFAIKQVALLLIC